MSDIPTDIAPAPKARERFNRRRQFSPIGWINAVGARRRVLWPAGIVGAVMVGLITWQVLIPRTYYTGSNSVGVSSIVASVAPHQTMCVPGLHVPAETGEVRLALYAHRPTIDAAVRVSTPSGTTVSDASAAVSPESRANLDARIPTRPAKPASVPATICVTPLNGAFEVGGTAGLEAGQQQARIGATPLTNRVAVWFLPPAGRQRSLASQAGRVFARAALFRPGIVGPWTYPVLLFAVLPFTWVLSLVLLLRASGGRQLSVRGRRVSVGLTIALIAFLNAGCWALITPAFNTPDEPDHFGYVQYLGETGQMPSKIPSAQPPYSTEEVLAVDGVDAFSVLSNPEARPPWLQANVHEWERIRASIPHPRDNGGGYTPAASSHAAPYYAVAAAGYELVRSQSVFSQLTVVRLISALLGAIAAACAYGIVRELFPRLGVAAVAAGLLVAFHPMFGFISGAVNNDNGINAAAALALYMTIRALRRGMSWRLALGLGVTLALAPLAKETGYEIYPAVAVGLLGVVWRSRRSLRPWPWVALAAGFGVVQGAWALLQSHMVDSFEGHAVAGGGPAATSAVSLAMHMPGRYLEYLWELFLPRLSFMRILFPPGWPFFQVYIERGWASFGWYTFDFPKWVYVIIVVTMGLVGLLSLTAAWRHRTAVRGRGFELLVIVLFPLCVLLAVEAAFFAPDGGRTVVAEQGRYIFPAIAALAAIAVGGTFGLGRRWQVPLATALVVAMIGLSYASQLLTLGSFFT